MTLCFRKFYVPMGYSVKATFYYALDVELLPQRICRVAPSSFIKNNTDFSFSLSRNALFTSIHGSGTPFVNSQVYPLFQQKRLHEIGADVRRNNLRPCLVLETAIDLPSHIDT